MWNAFLKDTLLKPVLARLTGWATIWLLNAGDWLCANINACGLVTEGGAQTALLYVSGVAVVAFEICLDWLNRKSAEKKAVARAFGGGGL